MKTFAITTSLVALVPHVMALTIYTPSSVVECQPQLLSWTDGVAPYYLSIIPGGQPSAAPIKSFDTQNANSITWDVDIAKGTSITFALKDSTGATAFTDKVTVQPGTTCSTSGSGSTTTPAAGADAAADGAADASTTASVDTPGTEDVTASVDGVADGIADLSVSGSSGALDVSGGLPEATGSGGLLPSAQVISTPAGANTLTRVTSIFGTPTTSRPLVAAASTSAGSTPRPSGSSAAVRGAPVGAFSVVAAFVGAVFFF